jgi:hypothetical protein
MTREKVRSLKRALRAGSRTDARDADVRVGGESALALLARSIDFGHGRLAVVRLAMAVHAGAQVPREHWLYCARVVSASQDRKLQQLYVSAAANAVDAFS